MAIRHRRSVLFARNRGLWALLLLLAAALPAYHPVLARETAGAEDFCITSGAKGNLVKFESKAPLESFDGKTSAVSGTLRLDPAAIAESIAVAVEVDMATFDTGISLRNQHMRENHLHPDKFPKSSFRGGKVVKGAGTSLADGAAHDIVVEGVLDLHGVARTVQLPMKLQLQKGDAPRLRVETRFDVKLSDHEIPRPQMLFMQLGETQKVVATLTCVKGGPAPPVEQEAAATETETP